MALFFTTLNRHLLLVKPHRLRQEIPLQQRRQILARSVTGVEVSLPVAGPGARSFAFLIDWTIRALLAIAWFGTRPMISLSATATP